ncbi:receptor-interacting serine/threonine-protein kinase 2-like isoform X1 [Poecile atricapillus]|uniref:receptor-interacting serine/threonine-protein kinase 2-like isoform X1 n=2 Tax=Poecile atricapillus TaxID=48891 RepID=UPI0027384CFA|nr:receptor-interacting serine/threonine-protein kinase 2-like isoform X1 [Poecile atricapillus]XP_058701670.1 receptor-interacting serine/threonine-protein kinase 2-like isoform X1 [Poecile atricapillus]XP_058701671.1 receptor-interacting serine/threonine-protein kinase 2-like isoform X1 [Poecile atricapillus]XP_058701672.1 receptor-interacting serine/threonine-protein kinase 2-like isoform X1 [Poecile atricapillus]XP_058701673.1 receptor-interacting serine/threonine-protein kinase 2-like isof
MRFRVILAWYQQFHSIHSIRSILLCLYFQSHQEMASPLPMVTQEDLESFSLTRTGSGFALKAFHLSWNTSISVKLLTSQDTTDREWKLLLQDIASVRHYESEHLLPFLGIYQYHGLVGIVTEWMNNGSLHSLIHEHQLYPELPFPLLIRILLDVAEGLHHLHSLGPALCHCSLKPSNVLLDVQYRAKISDYGLTNWRKQQLKSDLQNCHHRNCQDLVYLPPEILEGGHPSQEGDIYSFGILCWESLSRQKPFEGQTTLLDVLRGICHSLRPGISENYIPSNLPERNRLLHLIVLCWHQEPDYRPHTAECVHLLNGVLTTINKELISAAIYNLMDAKERALNACKGSETYTLQRGTCNSEIICPQKDNHLIRKKIPLVVPSLSTVLLDSTANTAGRDNIEMGVSNTTSQNATATKDHPGSERRKSSSFCTAPSSGSTAGKESSQHNTPPLALKHRPQPMCLGQAVPGPCSKGNCCQILACQRQTILNCMTEGRLNHILDVLRSQQTLSRMDYETITSYPTVTGRARALLDTCLCLGERAAQAVVTALSVNKCSPLGQVIHCPDCPLR